MCFQQELVSKHRTFITENNVECKRRNTATICTLEAWFVAGT